MSGKKLSAEYAYTRPELRKVPRLFLMLYLEERYKIPRSKAMAEKGYTGPYTALILEEEAVIDLIWECYQKEDIAGTKSLKKDAPRPPDIELEEDPEEEKEEVKVEIDTSPIDPPEEEPIVEEPPARKPKKTKESKSSLDIESLLEGVLAPVNQGLADLMQGINQGSDERKAIYDLVNQLLEESDRSAIILRNAILLLGGLVGDIRGIDLGIDNAVLEEAFMLGVELSNRGHLEEPPKDPKTNGKGKSSSKKNGKEEKDEEVSTTVVSDTGGAYDIEIDGESHRVSILSLQDESKFPSALLTKLGAALGIEVRGMPRVRSVPMLWDELVTQFEG